ncbi:unnamed protein product, partial [Cuscuta campestris]
PNKIGGETASVVYL